MQRALLMAVLIAVPMALLSCLVVLRGWSLIGDAIAHAVFLGLVLAHLLGLPVMLGAVVAGLSCVLLANYVSSHSRVKADTAMGIVFSGMFGLALVLMVHFQPSIHIDQLLFGDLLGTATADLRDAALIALAVIVLFALKWRELLVVCFDPVQARAVGIRDQLWRQLLLAVIAVAVVGALKAMGVVLAVALLIAPGAIALLLCTRFVLMLIVAVVVAAAAAVFGLYLSFRIDSAPAPTIVLIMTSVFVLLYGRARRADPQSA